MTFEEYMKETDKFILNICSMTSDTIPDYIYRDEYDSGTTPLDCAVSAVENACEYLGFDPETIIDYEKWGP